MSPDAPASQRNSSNSREMLPDAALLDHISQPVLNPPHAEPSRHWQLAEDNTATGVAINGRRPSQAMSIVPKERSAQMAFQTVPADENELVNRIRVLVGAWREAGYPDATDASKRLMRHWRSEANVPRLFFAQVEAAETLIWLTEANASRTRALGEIRGHLDNAANDYNASIWRAAVRMATGAGKTAVMGMSIAWQAINAAASLRRDERYTTSFLALAPGHTVRERLAVLDPNRPDNIYDEMLLVPTRLRRELSRVQIRVLNFQAFQQRDRLADLKSADAKKLIRSGRTTKEVESMKAVLDRTLKGLPEGRGAPKVCVLNDEAHHCYLPAEGRRTSEDDDSKAAAIWFGALEALRDTDRLGPVYDFSATPIFIEGSDRKELMFPWVVSDFPLMDSIESGLVKIPQVPVSDDSPGSVEWRSLYDHTVPKKGFGRDSVPATLKRAISALYESYERKYDQWMNPDDPAKRMPTPPVFIVVANEIATAAAIADYIAGWSETPSDDTGTIYHEAACPLFANYTTAGPTDRVRTLLVHSQIEGDSNLSKPIKAQAKRLRAPGDARDDRDVIRGALNSVGRLGGDGEHIRCVVSVSMLTEGWDTRTVTHILGFRKFSTQLLCEQVTGRALRRSNYDHYDDDGLLVPEYAEVIGVPFQFMPVKDPSADPEPPKPRYTVRSLPGRARHRIWFPNVERYITRTGSRSFRLVPERVIPWSPSGATKAKTAGPVGPEGTLTAIESMRHRQALTSLAAAVVDRWVHRIPSGEGEDWRVRRRLLFHDAYRTAQQWLRLADVHHSHVDLVGSSHKDQAADEIADACELVGASPDHLLAVYADPILLDSSGVEFETSLSYRHNTEHSELDIAACHSRLEAICAAALDAHPDVTGWARNFRLGWTIPYLWQGAWHEYEPDFVARLFGDAEDDQAVHLIVECKGAPDEQSRRKHLEVQSRWIPAVQSSRQLPDWLRRWHFAELTDHNLVGVDLDKAIQAAAAAHQQVTQGAA